MIKDIFINNSIQENFNTNGFVTIQLLNEEEIIQLNNIFEKYKNKHPIIKGQGYNISSYSKDLDYKKNINNELSSIINIALKRHFINYHLIGSAFAYKVPDKKGFLSPHQEWTMLNEEKYVSITCWIPLVDITSENGILYVLPKSHYPYFKTIRGIGIEQYFKKYEKSVIKNSIPIQVKAGEAIILNQSLIHFSLPNTSNHIRKAIITSIKSEEAKDTFLYYFNKTKNKIEKYIVDEDFAIKFDDLFKAIHLQPEGKLIEEIEPNSINQLDKEKLDTFFNNKSYSLIETIKTYLFRS